MTDSIVSRDDFSPLIADAATAARRLLGCIIERQIDGQSLRGRIVEVEAYDQADLASHSYNGPAGRAATMFGSAGHSYVYFTYGMHYCCNIVVGEQGYGAGALIRAVEPLEGIEQMEQRRGGKTGVLLTNGPGKLCQALGIDRTLDGHDLSTAPLRLVMQPALDADTILTTTRIGISKAKDVMWRFAIIGNPYVSVKR
ncbi:MAG: DNA-3-methyladenine glycosylase [Candidatus Saccharimonadales bacterium]